MLAQPVQLDAALHNSGGKSIKKVPVYDCHVGMARAKAASGGPDGGLQNHNLGLPQPHNGTD